jgi:hypothetical protein
MQMNLYWSGHLDLAKYDNEPRRQRAANMLVGMFRKRYERYLEAPDRISVNFCLEDSTISLWSCVFKDVPSESLINEAKACLEEIVRVMNSIDKQRLDTPPRGS